MIMTRRDYITEPAQKPTGEVKKRPMPFLALFYGFRKFVGVTSEVASRSLLKAEAMK